MEYSVVAMALVSGMIGTSMGISGIGGFLLVPAMLLILGSAPGEAVLTALVANLAVTVAAGALAVRERQVNWTLFLLLCVGGAGGLPLSLGLVESLTPALAKVVIACFLTGMGLLVLLGPRRDVPRARSTQYLQAALIGALAQISAVLAGIGGPAITVPALSAQGQRERSTIGTSLLFGVVATSLAIAVVLSARPLPEWTRAALLFPAIVVAFAILGSYLRARFATTENLRRIVGLAALLGGLLTPLSLALGPIP